MFADGSSAESMEGWHLPMVQADHTVPCSSLPRVGECAEQPWAVQEPQDGCTGTSALSLPSPLHNTAAAARLQRWAIQGPLRTISPLREGLGEDHLQLPMLMLVHIHILHPTLIFPFLQHPAAEGKSGKLARETRPDLQLPPAAY